MIERESENRNKAGKKEIIKKSKEKRKEKEKGKWGEKGKGK